jgi:hypothetical protein
LKTGAAEVDCRYGGRRAVEFGRSANSIQRRGDTLRAGAQFRHVNLDLFQRARPFPRLDAGRGVHRALRNALADRQPPKGIQFGAGKNDGEKYRSAQSDNRDVSKPDVSSRHVMSLGHRQPGNAPGKATDLFIAY